MTDKHVESLRVPCLDEGSTPSSSTEVTGETAMPFTPAPLWPRVVTRDRSATGAGGPRKRFGNILLRIRFFLFTFHDETILRKDMKKLFVVCICLLFAVENGHAQLRSRVDERFELTSIMFALAGAPEYCSIGIPSYLQDIIDELTPYQESEPINYVRVLNQRYLIGYNAVSGTAAMMEIVDGEVRLQPQYDVADVVKYDNRWTEELFTTYLEMVNRFYRESDFHAFFTAHRPLYDEVTAQMDALLDGTVPDWFRSFFGKPLAGDIEVYVSLTNGPSNYAIPGGILIGSGTGVGNGQPYIDGFNAPFLVIHELSHHYTNPLFLEWWPRIEPAANVIYPHIADMMRTIGYGDASSALCEWMNDLFVIMYMTETGNENIPMYTALEMNKGFFWMERSVDFMRNFYADRERYPHVGDFMPQLVAFINYIADNFDLVLAEYENRRPYITNVYPAVGSDISGFEEIVITFSEPMFPSWGFNGTGTDDPTVECLPFDKVTWSEDGMRVTLCLQQEELKEDTRYGVYLRPSFFGSIRKFGLNEKCTTLNFHTISQ